MTDPDQAEKKDLADLLRERNLLHPAQIDLAVNDHQINDMPLAEVLLFRGWITQETLDELAPFMKEALPEKLEAAVVTASAPARSADTAKAESSSSSDSASSSKAASGQQAASSSQPVSSSGPSSTQLRESPVKANPEKNQEAYQELIKKILSDKG